MTRSGFASVAALIGSVLTVATVAWLLGYQSGGAAVRQQYHDQYQALCNSTYERTMRICAAASRCASCDQPVRYVEWCPVWVANGEGLPE